MNVVTRPNPLVIRCDRCGGPLARCEDESYCPDCVSFELAAEPAPAPGWFVAATTGGHYVNEGPDLEALLNWCRGVIEPGDDVVVSAGSLVYAVLRGDGLTVRVR
jgi:hypothetical protein